MRYKQEVIWWVIWISDLGFEIGDLYQPAFWIRHDDVVLVVGMWQFAWIMFCPPGSFAPLTPCRVHISPASDVAALRQKE